MPCAGKVDASRNGSGEFQVKSIFRDVRRTSAWAGSGGPPPIHPHERIPLTTADERAKNQRAATPNRKIFRVPKNFQRPGILGRDARCRQGDGRGRCCAADVRPDGWRCWLLGHQTATSSISVGSSSPLPVLLTRLRLASLRRLPTVPQACETQHAAVRRTDEIGLLAVGPCDPFIVAARRDDAAVAL
jgi:hypothetical protein